MGSCCALSHSPEAEDEIAGQSAAGLADDFDPTSPKDWLGDNAAEAGPLYIPKDQRGPQGDIMAPGQPDWRWEHQRGKWNSYSVEESLEIDRYWTVFGAAKKKGKSGLQLAKVSLQKRSGVIDFLAMTCQVEGGGKPRSIRRFVSEDWLSNRFFFEAFKAALARAGVSVDTQPEDMFDFRLNRDFRNMRDDGRPMSRGGQKYELPIGWKRFALNVRGTYDSGNNGWLKEDDSGWAVAYHGTSPDSLPGILGTGFRVGDRQKFEKTTGAGVYCTPWIDVAQHYCKPQVLDGRSVQVVLQLRVKPSAIRPITDKSATAFEKKYWVINSPRDMRPYGVVIREFALKDYIPPEVMVFGKDHPAGKKALADLKDG